MSTQLTQTPTLDSGLFGKFQEICKRGRYVSTPFSVEVEGSPCVAATDGSVFIVARGEREGVGPYSGAHEAGIKRLLSYPSIMKGTWHRDVEFAALREWVRSPEDACAACEGTGRAYTSQKSRWHGLLFGAKINRELISAPFARLRADLVDVLVPDDQSPILIAANDWCVMFAPMPKGRGEELPTFPESRERTLN